MTQLIRKQNLWRSILFSSVLLFSPISVKTLTGNGAVEEYFGHIEKHLFSTIVTNIHVSGSREEREGYIGNFSRLALQYFHLRKTSNLEASEKTERIIKLGFEILTDDEKDIFQDPYKRNSPNYKWELPKFLVGVEYDELVRECLYWLKSL